MQTQVNQQMRILVTGATGFIGRRLLSRLDRAVVLTRNIERAKEQLAGCNVSVFGWDPASEPAPPEAFHDVDAVIHLAGDPVANGRWRKEKKARIRDSRVQGTRNLVATLADLSAKPKVLVSASAVGFYGTRGDEELDEASPAGNDFLADVCFHWEAEARKAEAVGIRVVMPRVGMVLGKEGGALSKMLRPFKMCVGGRLGNGRQWWPWIHANDMVNLILFAVENDGLAGPVNGTSPNPVTNREFTKTLARVLRRPAIFPMPRFMLRALFGEFGGVLMTSQRALPSAVLDAGFSFEYPLLEEALRAAVKN